MSTTHDHGFRACGREGCRQRRTSRSKYCSHVCATRDRWTGYQHRARRSPGKASISVSAEVYAEIKRRARARGVTCAEVVEAGLRPILDAFEAAQEATSELDAEVNTLAVSDR